MDLGVFFFTILLERIVFAVELLCRSILDFTRCFYLTLPCVVWRSLFLVARAGPVERHATGIALSLSVVLGITARIAIRCANAKSRPGLRLHRAC